MTLLLQQHLEVYVTRSASPSVTGATATPTATVVIATVLIGATAAVATVTDATDAAITDASVVATAASRQVLMNISALVTLLETALTAFHFAVNFTV